MSKEQEQQEQDGEAAVAFENVTKGFGGRNVIDGVSFAVERGEAVCILGRSGTGKSVTLKMMIGLLKADSGKVLVEGEDVGSLNESGLAKMRRKMGFLFQNAALFDSFSVSDNLFLPLYRMDSKKPKEEHLKTVKATLKLVGLEKDGDKMPVALSGGMQKRAGLARALVMKPEILLIDEPSSGLDRITASEIDHLLQQVKEEQKTTMVIVTHDIHGARAIGDKFAVLSEGKLLAFGTPEDLDKKDDKELQQFISER